MKKVLTLVLALTLAFPCASIAEKQTTSNLEVTIPFSFGSRTGVYTGEIIDGMPDGYGCFRTTNPEGEAWVYIGEFSNCDMNGQGETFWSVGQYQSGIYKNGVLISGTEITSDGRKIVGTFANETDQSGGFVKIYGADDVLFYEGGFSNDVANGYGKLYKDGVLYYEGAFENDRITNGIIYNKDGTASVIGDASKLNVVSSAIDILSVGNNADLIKEAAKSFDINTIINILNEYEDTNVSMAETDNYFVFKADIDIIQELLEHCTISYDSIDKNATVFYKGIEEVTNKINVIPYVKDGKATIRFGFIADDWIFFDRITIAADGMENIDNYYKKTVTDVLNGGKIIEYVDSSLSNAEYVQIQNKTNYIVRFRNKEDGKFLDHSLTPKEVSALMTISTIGQKIEEIYWTCYRWMI